MKNTFLVLLAFAFVPSSARAASGEEPSFSNVPSERNVYRPYRVGFNFIRTAKSGSLTSIEDVAADIANVGGQGIRQLSGWDLGWFSTWDGSGTFSSSSDFDFSEADALLRPDTSNNHGLFAMPTLFVIGPNQQGSGLGDYETSCDDDSSQTYCKVPYTPGGKKLDLDDSSVTAQVTNYARSVADHYRNTDVTHFEVYNELERFESTYACIAGEFIGWWTYSPAEYVELLEKVRTTMQSVDSDMRTVMAGLWYGDTECGKIKTLAWLNQFLKAGGNDLTPAINFHYYGEWYDLKDYIDQIKDVLEDRGISRDRKLWMTEVGKSYSATSETGQAQSIFKFFSVAFGNGVSLANWHTHVSSSESSSNWGGYGVRKSNSQKVDSWSTYQLFAQKLGNFETCTEMRYDTADVYVYKYQGSLYSDWPAMTHPTYVAWYGKNGNKSMKVSSLLENPSGWSRVRISNTVTLASAEYSINATVTFSDQPILIERVQ